MKVLCTVNTFWEFFNLRLAPLVFDTCQLYH